MNKDKEIWNETIKNIVIAESGYDGWLDKYQLEKLNNTDVILELGCGWGDDTTYLFKMPPKLICCDFSEESIKLMGERFPGIDLKQFDLRELFPFTENFADVVVADLCLHYFRDREMMHILNEIKRVLKDDGRLLCRVNSDKDINHGAGEGQEIENGLFLQGDSIKRFFNQEMIFELFKPFKIQGLIEYESEKYPKKKVMWEFEGRK